MTESVDNKEHIKPWYKQFWPWFIMALPASAVIAGLITVAIAFKNADSLVVDDYYKAGLAINDQIQQQTNASNYGYSAILRRLPDNRLFLKFEQSIPADETLFLQWSHPLLADEDFTVVLHRQADGSFQNKAEHNLSGRWHLRLSNNYDWLLKTEIKSGMDAVHLTPRLN